jgi:prepilin signal peptidase PulO-like enzyme (type II secretory pathway)
MSGAAVGGSPVSVDSLPVAGPSVDTRPRLLRAPATAAPFVAGVVVLAFATLALKPAVVAAFAASALVVLAAIDIERGIIPNRIVLPMAGIVLVAQIALFPGRALEWVLAAILAALVLMIPQLLGRAWMGMGDVKLVLLVGAALGWGVVGAVLMAFVCVFPFTLIVLIREGLAARRATIPFGPFLALGALIVLFGPHLVGLPTS